MPWVQVSEGPWSKRRKHQAVVYDNKLLILGGFDGEGAYDLNDVWSWDNQSWQEITEHAGWSGRDGHCALVYNNVIFVLGGTDDPFNCKKDVWKSDDGGRNWRCLNSSAPWPERWQHAACVHNNKMFLSGGWGERYLNDVWCSSDGTNWIQVSANAPWKARMFHSFISFNGALYIIGGHDGKMQLRDVWASNDDGLTWNEICHVAQWEGRQGHSCVLLDGHVYLMGGFGGATRFNDVWRSRDCAHWTLVTRHALWSPRQGHASIAYSGCLYVLGGFSEAGYCNDVYCLPVVVQPAGGRDGALASCSYESTSSVELAAHSTFQPNRILTVSQLCALESVADLRRKRAERDGVLSQILTIVGYVMSVVQKQGSSSSSEVKMRAAEESEPPSKRKHDPGDCSLSGVPSSACQSSIDSHDDFSTTSTATDNLVVVSNEGLWSSVGIASEGIAAKKLSVNEKLARLESFVSGRNRVESDEDLRMLFWSFLPQSESRESLGALAEAEEVDKTPPSARSSAMLREDMDRGRRALYDIQKRIRQTAVVEDSVLLIESRTELARNSLSKADQLLSYVHHVHALQRDRERQLARVLKKLEFCRRQLFDDSSESHGLQKMAPDVVNTSVNEGSSDGCECSWTEWEATLNSVLGLAEAISQRAVDEEIRGYCRAVRVQAQLCAQLGAWLDGDDSMIGKTNDVEIPSSLWNLSPTIQEVSSPIPAFHSAPTSSRGDDVKAAQPYELLAKRYEATLEEIDRSKLKVKKAVDLELSVLSEKRTHIDTVAKACACKAIGLVRGMSAQSHVDIMEISAMESEVTEWKNLLTQLQDSNSISRKCTKHTEENAANEEKLIKLENDRIDAKSRLEKATLHLQRRSPRAPTPRSQSTDNNIEELKLKLSTSEKAVKEARREIRDWYRSIRSFAVEVAPELFVMLPDLQVPGAVLGDGGFAESAHLPHRHLDEYEEISPLVVDAVDEGNSSSGLPGLLSGRHLMLKAVHDGEEVVLKGFVMNEGDQRKGFERELSILSKLHNDSIICPRAIVDGGVSYDNPSYQVTVFIEYPFCKGGNLSSWLKAANRKPWELQGIARQLLYGLIYLHDHNIIHKDIKPSNILLHEDGRVVLTDFELSREAKSVGEEASTTIRSGTRGFMSPEVESGSGAVGVSSDMYSFGILLLFMHFPTLAANMVPGRLPPLPESCDIELADLIKRLVAYSPASRPTATATLMHPYFRSTFIERLMSEGEVVEQNRKLEAVRNVLHKVRSENRTNLERIMIRRDHVVEEVLCYFQNMDLQKMRANLRVTFLGEAGVDEGGLLTELFSIFFEAVFRGDTGLFVGSDADKRASSADGAVNSKNSKRNKIASEEEREPIETSAAASTLPFSASHIVLPSAADLSESRLGRLRAFGRSMVKALYEGRRIGSRLCPSVFKFLSSGVSPDIRDLQMFDPQTARSLQWMLATVGVEEFGLHFESVGAPELGPVNDSNKARFVRMSIDYILVDSRRMHLEAIKQGFVEALRSLSEEAAPFMSLLSHTDWRVLLCGDTAVSGPQVVAALKFTNFSSKSKIPQWLKEIILSSSEDHLRQLLVFVTGSPSLSPNSGSSGRVEINVRAQPRSESLPIAHTCFYHLDIPDYKDKEVLQSKLMYAIQNAATFEIV